MIRSYELTSTVYQISKLAAADGNLPALSARSIHSESAVLELILGGSVVPLLKCGFGLLQPNSSGSPEEHNP
ncbi:MAG: hypothetical protein DMG13_34170 [Acidobacteria bacterium]|nr:MAG: hypothetical protein DMG13_34170 [Acidobacteriota bacterium]